MSSYFDYFCKTHENVQVNDEIKGTCYSMCPPDEVKLRETQKLVHVLEVLGNERKLIKSYTRSAADSHMAVPRLLRPYSALIRTVQYLLLDVTQRVEVPESVVYDFVNDRLRAVRQDMTIQRLPPEDCIKLLEPMIRFYVYFGYILSNSPISEYDPVLNKKHLLECTKLYLNFCDKIDQNCKDGVDNLTGLLNNIDIQGNSERELACDQELVECLYILCNLDNIHPLCRYIERVKCNKRETKLHTAYELALANLQGNFIKVGRLMDKLCPLTYCAVYTYLPVLQRHALQILSHAYHNKSLTVPSKVIAEWLHFCDQREAETTCAHYGLKVDNSAILFNKNDYKTDTSLHQPTGPKSNLIQNIKTKYNIENISYIYTYTDK